MNRILEAIFVVPHVAKNLCLWQGLLVLWAVGIAVPYEANEDIVSTNASFAQARMDTMSGMSIFLSKTVTSLQVAIWDDTFSMPFFQ